MLQQLLYQSMSAFASRSGRREIEVDKSNLQKYFYEKAKQIFVGFYA